MLQGVCQRSGPSEIMSKLVTLPAPLGAIVPRKVDRSGGGKRVVGGLIGGHLVVTEPEGRAGVIRCYGSPVNKCFSRGLL